MKVFGTGLPRSANCTVEAKSDLVANSWAVSIDEGQGLGGSWQPTERLIIRLA